MTLQLRHLKIRITTSKGLFGVELPLESGLFIIHADNTCGKSTCLNSILYALGLEGMLSPSKEVPLPSAVTDFLDHNNKRYDVLESEVLLEISNGNDIVTIKRQIKGTQSKNLINVWDGPTLSQNKISYASQDYTVRTSGSAVRKIGFHHFLANFIGWKLPNVLTYNENEVPLYLETLFPFMFVEQKHGWSNLRSRFPSYLRIKEVSRRSFEFILALDAQKIASQKIILHQKSIRLKDSWLEKVNECKRLVDSINAIINDLPTKPTPFPP
jgi:AAA domain